MTSLQEFVHNIHSLSISILSLLVEVLLSIVIDPKYGSSATLVDMVEELTSLVRKDTRPPRRAQGKASAHEELLVFSP